MHPYEDATRSQLMVSVGKNAGDGNGVVLADIPLDVLGNDSDADNDTLSVVSATATLSHDASLSPSEYHARVAKVTPVLAEGFALDMSYIFLQEEKASLKATVGGFAWEADFSSEYQGTTIKSSEDGIDPYIGLGLDYQLAEDWSAGWQLTRYFLDVNDVTTLAVKVGYHFGG